MSNLVPPNGGNVPLDLLERFEVALSAYKDEIDEFLVFVLEPLGKSEPVGFFGALSQALEELLERLANMPEEDDPMRMKACAEFQRELIEVEAEDFAEALREADEEIDLLCAESFSARHTGHARTVLERWAAVKAHGWHTYNILICAAV